MSTRLRTRFTLSNEEARAAALGAIAGALAIGLLLELTGRNLGVAAIGRTVGGDYSVGWLVLLAASAVFAALFTELLSRTVGPFAHRMILLSSQRETLQRILVPLLRRSALTVAATTLGLGYGAAIAVVCYVLLLPAELDLVTNLTAPFPNLDPVGALVWVLYGGLLGVVYGLSMEH